ncbi:MAG TPA: hypothetical protein VFQ52_08820 [Rhizomicrobium sp.]|nr:hypothetical protein [Rhizomicrobium sp.]
MRFVAIYAAVFAAVWGAAFSAQADPRDDALSAMLRCSALTDRAARLGCYDATVSRAPGALNQPAAIMHPPVANVPPPAAPVAAQRERSSSFVSGIFGSGPSRAVQTSPAQFGSESIANGGARAYPIPMDGDTVDQISARLIGYAFENGFVTVTLDNGQVWRQTAGADPVGHLSRPALSYAAVIARGSINGSYTMKLSGLARPIAVRRIR